MKDSCFFTQENNDTDHDSQREKTKLPFQMESLFQNSPQIQGENAQNEAVFLGQERGCIDNMDSCMESAKLEEKGTENQANSKSVEDEREQIELKRASDDDEREKEAPEKTAQTVALSESVKNFAHNSDSYVKTQALYLPKKPKFRKTTNQKLDKPKKKTESLNKRNCFSKERAKANHRKWKREFVCTNPADAPPNGENFRNQRDESKRHEKYKFSSNNKFKRAKLEKNDSFRARSFTDDFSLGNILRNVKHVMEQANQRGYEASTSLHPWMRH